MKKRYWIVILCVMLVLTAVVLLPVTLHAAVAEDETSGQCGDDLYWEFDESTSTLTITGSGAMKNDYWYSDVPWYSYRANISTIVLPEELTSIGYNAFYGCTRLSMIDLPAGLTDINGFAFYQCTSLMKIEFPAGLESIGDSAFKGCTSLTAVSIPDSVTKLGYEAFYGCSGIQNITIPTGITYIDVGVFADCESLTEIFVPGNVKLISSLAFFNTGLEIVTLADGVEAIGIESFEGCPKLISITIPESVTTIKRKAFLDCNALSDVYYEGTAEQRESISVEKGNETLMNAIWHCRQASGRCGDNLYWSFDEDTGTLTITGRGDMYDFDWDHSPWYFVRSIITALDFPDRMTSIGNSAFCDCTGLISITIPDSVAILGSSAFSGCTGLIDITIPGNVRSIGQGAFSYCTGLESVMIGNGVINIYENAFESCTGLTDISIPGSVTRIRRNTFYGCTALTAITIPNRVESIDPYAFYNCTGIADVYYIGTITDRENRLVISYGNDDLLNAEWHYLIEAIEGTVEWNPEDVKFKGTTPYVICNGSAQTPRFTVKNSADGSVVDPANYDYEYRENTDAGTGYVIVTFKGDYEGTCRGFFKIYLPPTTTTTVENVSNGIKLTWSPVEGAAGYVIYRRAWSSTTDGWTTFERWNNTTGTTYIDGADDSHKVYAGTRYQYGVKAYFARRVDPVTGATIGGNVGDNFNLGEVGPLKTTVRITTRVLNSVTAGSRQMTVKWTPSRNFTGYQIKYATDANFTKNVKAIKITDWSTAEKIITGLTRGTTYYVTIRSYHEFNGMTYFGEWSNVKSCRVR